MIMDNTHTEANHRGVADDRYNLFRELPFWLRIGPINWRNIETEWIEWPQS